VLKAGCNLEFSFQTDKASMLDEAIEYLRTLQLQIQMISMRTGLRMPPMVRSAGTQYLQIPSLEMTSIPSLGLGMGMSMGMGMMDMAASTSNLQPHGYLKHSS
jgi:phytochrome-interacting factor 3